MAGNIHGRGAPLCASLVALVIGLGGSVAAYAAEHEPRILARGAESYGPVTPHLSARMDSLPRAAEWRPGDSVREVPRRVYPKPSKHDGSAYGEGLPDPLLQNPHATRAPTLTLDVNIAGIGFTGSVPPDTVGDVGPNHFVQAVNSSVVQIYNKAGSLVSGPTNLESLAPAGDACQSGSGDPIVLYDELADRWFLQEFTSGGRLCIYISQTPDPTGAYFFYGFNPPSFPDYPHYGVWPTGYYAGTNEGGANVTSYAFDRARMLVGAPATMQRLASIPEVPGYGFQTLTPVDHDGAAPPAANAPGVFMRHFDGEAHGASNPASDLIQMFEMNVDWTVPANTTISTLPAITITDFNSWFINFTTFFSIPQPGSGTRLDPIREAILNRLTYRNFGSHETIVGNFATNRNPATSGSVVSAGIRWFELRRTGGAGNPWTLFQEGTYGGDTNSPTAQFFMGGIAMDGAGNIALGYSKTDTGVPNVFPSIGVTGRLAGDTLGTMDVETSVVAGVQASGQGGGRWGDYAAMGIDPADDCTFWYTNEYMPGASWGTRIASFVFEECLVGFTLTPTPISADVCALTDPDPQYSLDVSSSGGWAGNVTLAVTDGLPAGTTASFSTNNQPVDFTSVLTIQNVDTAAAGSYAIEVTGTGNDGPPTVRTATVELNLALDVPGTPTLTMPANGAIDLPATPTFTWTASADAEDYLFEIATDAAFTSIVYSATTASTSHTPSLPLASGTQHFWRVTARNGCADVASATFSFTTVVSFCATPNLAIPDNNVTGATSSVVIGSTETLDDLDLDVRMTHTWIGDLIFTLRHVQTGTTLTVIDRPGIPLPQGGAGCQGDNPDVIIDDEGTIPADTGCVNTNPGYPVGARVIPNNLLAAFDGEAFAGTWELSISDRAAQDTGTLLEWCLVPTFAPPTFLVVDDSYATNEDVTLTVAAPGVLANDVGTSLSATLDAGPSDGTLVGGLGTDGSFSYQPDPDFCGSDSFTYTATGTEGNDSATVTIAVTCVNDAPVAVADAFPATEDTPLVIAAPGVLVNDTDVDVPAQPLTAGNFSDPANGSVAAGTNGSFTYTPDANYCNATTPDTFTYTVSDGTATSAPATVSVTVACVNDGPVAGTIDDTFATATVPFSLDVSDAFTEPKGETLTFSATGLPASLTINPATGVISGTPTVGEIGPYTVTVTATDPGGASDDAAFTLDVVPVAIFADGFEEP
jgi:VCBS repeat-containing protein